MMFDPNTLAFNEQPLAPAEACQLIRRFAAARAYRSAAVEELAVGPGEYRRPLRPEDLEFLKFQRPIQRETVSRLPSLASQRLLFCLHERRMLRWPAGGAPGAVTDYKALFTPEMETIAARIRPFLTSYAFQFAASGAQRFNLPPAEAASRMLVAQVEGASAIHRHAASVEFVAEAARFALTQSWLLLPMQQAALHVAEAGGAFDLLPSASRPTLESEGTGQHLAEVLAREIGVREAAAGEDGQAQWQFYLATSLARPNLLWAFDGPADTFRLWGAAFAAEIDWLAFSCLIGKCAASLGLDLGQPGGWPGSREERAPVAQRLADAVQVAADRYGPAAATEVQQGFAIGAELADVAMDDLALQVEWLSQIESYRSAAALIEERIARERPDIDRDTFVEPRDMCSTTHVHNEHRLVSVESGDMIFWGNPGMKLELHPGDRILIPYGRLHGSTVTSPECTYHQPIIPDDWVAEALGRVNFLQIAS